MMLSEHIEGAFHSPATGWVLRPRVTDEDKRRARGRARELCWSIGFDANGEAVVLPLEAIVDNFERVKQGLWRARVRWPELGNDEQTDTVEIHSRALKRDRIPAMAIRLGVEGVIYHRLVIRFANEAADTEWSELVDAGAQLEGTETPLGFSAKRVAGS